MPNASRSHRADRTPRPWADEPDVIIPEWDGLGLGRLRPEQLSRHVLITGETGSGKTESAIRPLLRAVLRYPLAPDATDASAGLSLRGAMLVMDPKGELLRELRLENRRRRLRRRIVRFGDGSRHVAHFFEGAPPGSLAVDELAERTLALCPGYHLERTRTNSAFFILQAALAYRAMLAVDRHIFHRDGVRGLRVFWERLAQAIAAKIGSCPSGIRYERIAYLRPHAQLTSLMATHRAAALQAFLNTSVRAGVPAEELLALSAWLTMREETVACIVASAHSFLQNLSGALAERISFNPFEAPPRERWFSVRTALAEGWVVTMSPEPNDPIDVAAAVAVKGLYFAQLFERPNRERPFFYVADEAQVVLTMDTSAEHAFMDRCRAYRGAVILATQGVGSMKLRVNQLGEERFAHPALETLLLNTSTKLWFRSTDTATKELLRQLVPAPHQPGRPHVVDVCPPSSLETGECYVVGAGGWSRGHVQRPAGPRALARAR
jgi:hypothetical protein